MDALRSILQTLWVGGLWIVGIIVAPVMFRVDQAHAGMLVGHVLGWMGWVGIVCGSFLLIHICWRQGFRAVQGGAFWLVVGMLACTIINQFAVFPLVAELKALASNMAKGLFGGGFSTWHAISTLIYLVQCLLGLALVLREQGGR